MKVKGTARAWMTEHGIQFNDIERLAKEGKKDRIVTDLGFSNSDGMAGHGWTEVGIATITVDFFPREAIVSKQIEGLREQLRQHRINAEAGERAILDRISNLTAITAE